MSNSNIYAASQPTILQAQGMTLDSNGNLSIGGAVSAKGYRIAGEGRNTTTHFTVEKADNGFIRSRSMDRISRLLSLCIT